jgi:hypothetical protein
VHTLALQLTPIVAAEKSKVPFYVAGGILVAWAMVLSVGIGMRRPEFPASVASQRAVMAISAVLVLAALSTAVMTADVPAKGKVPPTHTETGAPIPVAAPPASAAAAGGGH